MRICLKNETRGREGAISVKKSVPLREHDRSVQMALALGEPGLALHLLLPRVAFTAFNPVKGGERRLPQLHVGLRSMGTGATQSLWGRGRAAFPGTGGSVGVDRKSKNALSGDIRKRTPQEQAIAEQTSRRARYEARLRKSGFKKTTVWVPGDRLEELKALVKAWNEAASQEPMQ